MSVSSCFWALLSLENFRYIYLPDFITDTQIALGKTSADILLAQSLLQFIHPDELPMAQTDLLNFVKIKTLAGAVTRCRLKSIKSIIYQQYGQEGNMDEQDWVVTDVVMYTATNSTVLTFFHSHDTDNINKVCYGSRQFNESTTMLNILALHSSLMSSEDPMRIFQIYNTETKDLIISWPNKSDDVAIELATTFTRQEMDKRVEHPLLKTDTACTHHSHSNSTHPVNPYGTCQLERIIITYGSLTFSSFQITPVIESSIGTYHHYMYMTPRKLLPPQPQTMRKSNINHILNETHEQHHYIPKETSKSPSPKAWRGRFGVYEKKCENCQTSTSPEWRRGPSGHKTLCNACGLRYARLVAKHERSQGKEELKQPFSKKPE